MKSRLLPFLLLCLLTTSSAYGIVPTNADPEPKNKELTPEQRARVETIERRVAEIRSMNLTSLSRAERKEIKQELKDMNQEAKQIRGAGIYLSIGAIIIILLLLILLL